MGTIGSTLTTITNLEFVGEADPGHASDGAGGWVVAAFLMILISAPGLFLLWTRVFTGLIDRLSIDRPQSPWSSPPEGQQYSTGTMASWVPPEAEFEDGTPSAGADWSDMFGADRGGGGQAPSVARQHIAAIGDRQGVVQRSGERLDAERLVPRGVISPDGAEAQRSRILGRADAHDWARVPTTKQTAPDVASSQEEADERGRPAPDAARDRPARESTSGLRELAGLAVTTLVGMVVAVVLLVLWAATALAVYDAIERGDVVVPDFFVAIGFQIALTVGGVSLVRWVHGRVNRTSSSAAPDEAATRSGGTTALARALPAGALQMAQRRGESTSQRAIRHHPDPPSLNATRASREAKPGAHAPRDESRGTGLGNPNSSTTGGPTSPPTG